MGDFNPANGQIRHAWETVPGIPDEANWHDHEFVSESISGDYQTIQSQSITTSAQTPQGQPSKIKFDGTIPVEWDPESQARYLANIQKHGSVTNPGGSAYLHKLAPSETDVDFPDSLSVEVSRDDDLPQLSKGARVISTKFGLQASSFYTGEVGLAVERAEYWEAATRIDVVGGTSPTFPIIRGLHSYDTWIITDNKIRFKVTSIAGVGSGYITGKFKIGTASSYGSTATNVYFGNNSQGQPIWTEVIDSNTGTRMGTRDLPVEAHIDLSANYVVNLEFSVDSERALWTPVLPDVAKFNEIYAKIKLGDSFATAEEYEIDQFDLTITRPGEPKFAIGGRHAKRVKQSGKRTVTGSLKREYLSIALRKKLERAQVGWLVCEAYNGEIISGSFEGMITLVAGAMILGGKTPSIGGQDSLDENYNFTCHPSGDATYPDDITILLQNSQSSLALGT